MIDRERASHMIDRERATAKKLFLFEYLTKYQKYTNIKANYMKILC